MQCSQGENNEKSEGREHAQAASKGPLGTRVQNHKLHTCPLGMRNATHKTKYLLLK